MKIKDIINETTSGGIATVVAPVGGTIKRPDPSVYTTKKKKKKKKKHESS